MPVLLTNPADWGLAIAFLSGAGQAQISVELTIDSPPELLSPLPVRFRRRLMAISAPARGAFLCKFGRAELGIAHNQSWSTDMGSLFSPVATICSNSYRPGFSRNTSNI